MSDINKKVTGSMLDDLLSDADKERVNPKKAYSHRGQDLFDDDGADPLDDGYRGYYRRSTPSVVNDVPKERTVISDALKRGGKVIIFKEDVAVLIDGYMKALAKQSDAMGVIWSSQGAIYMRGALQDLVQSCLYSSDCKEIIVDDGTFDVETGEVNG